jgi:hypothetical protein
MAWIFRREEQARIVDGPDPFAEGRQGSTRRPAQDAIFLGTMVALLVLANWGAPNREVGLFAAIHRVHWPLSAALLALVLWMAWRWYRRDVMPFDYYRMNTMVVK